MSIYKYTAKSINDEDISFEKYKGKVLLIVNTASRCGFTRQYSDLQELYIKFKEQGFVVLGFPCNQFSNQEPDENENIQSFCSLNYGVDFPLFQKTDITGINALPIFNYLTNQIPFQRFDKTKSSSEPLLKYIQEKHPEILSSEYTIKWNFTKFLIDRSGQVYGRFEATTEPLELIKEIESLLSQ